MSPQLSFITVSTLLITVIRWSSWYDHYLKINVFMLKWAANGTGCLSQITAYLEEVSCRLQYCFWFIQNDQPIFPGTRSFVFADDPAVVVQDSHFDTSERTLSSALENLSTYHKTNAIRDNPRKTQISLFHLHNIQAKRTLSPLTIIWEGTKLRVLYNSRILRSHPGQNIVI